MIVMITYFDVGQYDQGTGYDECTGGENDCIPKRIWCGKVGQAYANVFVQSIWSYIEKWWNCRKEGYEPTATQTINHLEQNRANKSELMRCE